MLLKVATLNLCLGLKNKKLLISEIMKSENIDVLCVQETEIEHGFATELLTINNYSFEIEQNSIKSRVGIYINKNIKYTRRHELEGVDAHVIVIDIIGTRKTTRLINIYRTFAPQEGISPRDKFKMQLRLIKNALTNNTIVMGDFNLDYKKNFVVNYAHSNLFEDFNEILSDEFLVQLVKFETWSRIVDLNVKASILDHVYVKDPSMVTNIGHLKPCFGDHELVHFNIPENRISDDSELRRDWRHYSKDRLLNSLMEVDWSFNIDNVQNFWNYFECMLLGIIDTIVPIVEFKNNIIKIDTPPFIKNKINVRNRLLKQFKNNGSIEIKTRIQNLNAEIKGHFYSRKKFEVRRGILPGNSKSLWKAVNIAKDQAQPRIPKNMTFNDQNVTGAEISECFGEFFSSKVGNIVRETNVKTGVYNGRRKMFAEHSMFMSREEIIECVLGLKIKNTEGYDRIPQRILIDGLGVLIEPLTKLFSMVYRDCKIPGQWLISKIIPVHKKGSKQEIVNYRPVANLCSVTKIFERLILNKIRKLEALNGVEVGGKNQHGFTKNKSTLTAGLQLQSLIARALDNDSYVAMASIDLSAAFDVVDVGLLLKRLRILGLPEDLVNLIEIWLKERYFYVSVGNHSSIIYTTWHGIVQGSILGPVLYAIFVSPLFDLESLTCFADDKYALAMNKDKEEVVALIQIKLENVVKWLVDSGMKVNEAKTDLCLFYKQDTTPITFLLNGKQITSNSKINVLGVIFDSKLQWIDHVALTLKKANSALCAIKLISRYFNTKELSNLITANFYSLLYYNSEIWHLPTLNPRLKQCLLAASAKAVKLCLKNVDPMTSYLRLHELLKRATPHKIMLYKHANTLFKLYNQQLNSIEFAALNFDQIITSRQTKFLISKNNNLKVGTNAICNRLNVLNGKIPLAWLNLSFNSFKLNCKKLFLE